VPGLVLDTGKKVVNKRLGSCCHRVCMLAEETRINKHIIQMVLSAQENTTE
jgi:hypothetical protein